jgi:hypothetical protein
MNLPKPALRTSTGWQLPFLQKQFIQPWQRLTAVRAGPHEPQTHVVQR